MSLLERIAHSNGDPERALTALRLINEHLTRQLSQQSASDSGRRVSSTVSGQSEIQRRATMMMMRSIEASGMGAGHAGSPLQSSQWPRKAIILFVKTAAVSDESKAG